MPETLTRGTISAPARLVWLDCTRWSALHRTGGRIPVALFIHLAGPGSWRHLGAEIVAAGLLTPELDREGTLTAFTTPRWWA